MATKYTKIGRSIDEVKYFLKYHQEDFSDNVRYIRPNQGWQLDKSEEEVYQLIFDLHVNLYEELFPIIHSSNPATDEDILILLRGISTYCNSKEDFFKKIINKYNSNGEDLPSIIGYAFDMWRKIKNKISEVLELAEEDLKIDLQSYNFELSIVTAAESELNSVLTILDDVIRITEEEHDASIYYLGCIKGDQKKSKVVVTKSANMGAVAAACSLTKLIYKFKPKIVVMLGHAAGNKNIRDLNYGDILIAESSIDYNQVVENKKNVEPVEPKKFGLEIQIDGSLKLRLERFTQNKELMENIKNKYSGHEKFINPLRCHFGILATGSSLLRSQEKINEIVKGYKGIVGIDMETYGVYYTSRYTQEKKIKFVSIKSVSDFGDNSNKDLSINERVSFAVYTSTEFFKHFALTELINNSEQSLPENAS